MMNGDIPETFLVLVAAAIIGLGAYNIGNFVGHDQACASVKMEWVNDKCMKVTREEVK